MNDLSPNWRSGVGTPPGPHVSLPRLAALFLKVGTIGFGGGMATIALILAAPWSMGRKALSR